jgi:hypothetical protein
MAKRSQGDFRRRKEDAYDTPLDAVIPLLPFLSEGTRFVEPCAGRGDLVAHLESFGHKCVGAFDIAPRGQGIAKRDALSFVSQHHYYQHDMVITNPPWTRPILHELIFHYYWQCPTWMLFDADWYHTKQALPYRPMVRQIVSAGRIKWIEGSTDKSKDNAAWYLLHGIEDVKLYGRKKYGA